MRQLWLYNAGVHLTSVSQNRAYFNAGVSNSRPAKALFAARDTLSEILKIWETSKLFYSFYGIFLLVTQRNYYFSHLHSLWLSSMLVLAATNVGDRQSVSLLPSLCVATRQCGLCDSPIRRPPLVCKQQVISLIRPVGQS